MVDLECKSRDAIRLFVVAAEKLISQCHHKRDYEGAKITLMMLTKRKTVSFNSSRPRRDPSSVDMKRGQARGFPACTAFS
jgi:hypothetical protein